MKVLPKKLLPLILFGIAVTSLFSVQPAQAGYIVTLEQVGSNVVATGSGAIDLTGLRLVGSTSAPSQMTPNLGVILTGPDNFFPNFDSYDSVSGPMRFGPGGTHTPSFGSGDIVGIEGIDHRLDVPQGYVSGAALSDSMTFDNKTLSSLGSSLGVNRGTFTWTWGTGPNQNFTLIVGSGVAPDSGSTVSLLGFALLGLAALRRKLGS